jgi:hypothetical protein
MIPAHRLAVVIDPVAVYAPVAVTIRYSGLMVTWAVGAAVLSDVSRVRPVKRGSGVNGSSFLVSTPNAPMRSSSAFVVVAVGPTLRLFELPVAVAVRSSGCW